MHQVWTQGGYEAEYAAEERFHKCCDSNPTLLHSFLEPCILFINLYVLNFEYYIGAFVLTDVLS